MMISPTHHPELVRIVANKHGPMLRRVGIRVDLLSYELAKPGLLREPLAREPADGVPADVHAARRITQHGIALWNDAGRSAKSRCALKADLALGEPRLPAISQVKVGEWTYSHRAAMSRLRWHCAGVSSGFSVSVILADGEGENGELL